MVRAIAAGIIGLLLFAALGGQAGAKGAVGFTITGGDLGEYAATVSVPMPDGPYLTIGIAIDETSPVSEPALLPELAYDLYPAGYVTAGGPDFRYYAALHLLHDVQMHRWLDLLPEAAAMLDDSIEQALISLERGELERGVAASWLRGRRMTEAQYWLRPYELIEPQGYSSPFMGRCGQCTPKIRDVEAFVMKDLVEVVSEQTVNSAERTPRFFIEFEAWDGQSGFGGLLGLYDPPSNGQPGLFWPHGPLSGPRGYETTPGFDAAIADALARRDERGVTEQEPVDVQSSGLRWASPIGAIAAVCLAALFAVTPRLRRLR